MEEKLSEPSMTDIRVCHYGMAFRSKRKEEDELTRIRQREREMQPKGLPV